MPTQPKDGQLTLTRVKRIYSSLGWCRCGWLRWNTIMREDWIPLTHPEMFRASLYYWSHSVGPLRAKAHGPIRLKAPTLGKVRTELPRNLYRQLIHNPPSSENIYIYIKVREAEALIERDLGRKKSKGWRAFVGIDPTIFPSAVGNSTIELEARAAFRGTPFLFCKKRHPIDDVIS